MSISLIRVSRRIGPGTALDSLPSGEPEREGVGSIGARGSLGAGGERCARVAHPARRPDVARSGWLYTTDAYWGVEWVGDLHDALSDALIGLAALHVGGVIFTSWRQRENLVAAMVHGRKRPAGERDVA
jgi:hypothetical protein